MKFIFLLHWHSAVLHASVRLRNSETRENFERVHLFPLLDYTDAKFRFIEKAHDELSFYVIQLITKKSWK